MTRKSGNIYKTNECGRCGKPHEGYSGKLDANNVEYVVCENTNKRMNVSGFGVEGFTSMYPTEWINMKTNLGGSSGHE